MSKHRMTAFAALAIALAACGTEDARTNVPVETIDDPVKYFGVEPCACYEYRGSDGTRLGIAVEAVTTGVIGNPDQQPEYIMRYRINGLEQRQYVLRPTDPDLLLRQVRIGGIVGETWVSDPFLPWLRFPTVPRNEAIEATVQMRVIGSQEPPLEVDFRANYLAETVEASRDGGVTTESFDATRISYRGLPFDEQFRWFVPEVGVVRIELENNDGDRTNYILDRKRQLGGSCPLTELGTDVGDTCGISEN